MIRIHLWLLLITNPVQCCHSGGLHPLPLALLMLRQLLPQWLPLLLLRLLR
jgi:hypothetical protein